MGYFFCRTTELVNVTRDGVEVRVYRRAAPPGEYVVAYRLGPGERKEIPATKFRDDLVDGGRGMIIKVVRENGGEFEFVTLLAQEFVSNTKLEFRIDLNGNLSTNKIRSDGTLSTELSRIVIPTRLLAFIRRLTTREPANPMRDDDQDLLGREFDTTLERHGSSPE